MFFSADFLFSVGEFLLLLSYLFTDMLYLRAVTLVSLCLFIAGALTAGLSAEGMKPTIVANTLAIVVNVYKIIKIYLDRAPIFLSPELKEIYLAAFMNMTPKEFKKICTYADSVKHKKKEVLTVEDKPVLNLAIIQAGYVDLLKNKEKFCRLTRHYFIGEMSFLGNSFATATAIVASKELTCLEWKREKLNKLQKKEPELFQKLHQAIALNLVKKLSR